MVINVAGMSLDISQVDYIKAVIDPVKGFGFMIHFKRNLNRAPLYKFYGHSKFRLIGRSDKEKATEAFNRISAALDRYRR